MWAKQKSSNRQSYFSGFTIVELLIVIVVIAVLAAISIVAYNGITGRARIATLTSDLTNAAKVMGADNATSGSYALSAGAVNGGKGLPASPGTTYQFRSTGTTYCITGTNSKISYVISNTATAPAEGACPGDLIGGNIANLSTNPSFEANTANWSAIAGATIARITTGSGIVNGSTALETAVTTANQSGVQYSFGNLQTNTPYTVSAYVTLMSGDGTKLVIRAGDGSGTRAWKAISSSLIVGQPVRINLSWTSSPTNPNGGVQIWRDGTATEPAVLRIDSAMLTTGSTLHSYADGSSPEWTWTGTANNSTSMGPPL